MTEAHVKRQMERQKFLAKAHKTLIDSEETWEFEGEHYSEFFGYFAHICLTYLLGMEVESVLFRGKAMPKWQIRMEAYFTDVLLPQVEAFGRAPEEVKALVAQLLEDTAGSVIGYRKAQLTHAEIVSPAKIFLALTATSRVED